MDVLKIVRNVIRVGQINSVDEDNGTVDVLFVDKDNQIASNLPLPNFEYNMPRVGEQALCVFLANGLEQGFCLFTYYSDISLPPVADKEIFRKQFDEGTYIEYNHKTRELLINADKPVKIKNDLIVEGNIVATGTITGQV
ncbi:phage baseplate assembly protein V [Gracilibacillus xinjiangensis]|uniref:Phage baseplate assembly protein V n=1 Tax=Gracilibacillus xinjiangensis TaxID=1193282 RepID=A0ABV8WTX3_9BACI